MHLLLLPLRHHGVLGHGLVREYSDVDQSLLIVLGCLVALTLGLISAAYLEPGSKIKNSRQVGGSVARRGLRPR